MALSIKDPEADRLAREVAKATGETLTAAVVQSLRERLAAALAARGYVAAAAKRRFRGNVLWITFKLPPGVCRHRSRR